MWRWLTNNAIKQASKHGACFNQDSGQQLAPPCRLIRASISSPA